MPALHRRYTQASALFTRDTRDWGLTPRHALLLALLPCVLALVAAATAPIRPLYRWLVAEDSLIEWLQFLCLLGASILLGRLTFRQYQTGNQRMALLYGLVALGAWFLTGEEISWGQRIFGWETPDALEEINRQGETTLHNIHGVQQLVPYAMLLAGLYGACVPLVWAVVGARWEHVASRHLLVPPLCLVPAFLLAAGYRLFRLLVWPTADFVISEYAEVMELCLYLGLLLFSWLNLRRLWQVRPELGISDAPHSVPRGP